MSKKIVWIVILVECILAVFLISFFGQAIFNAVNKIPVEYINFTRKDGTVIADGEALLVELSDSNRSYQLYWEIGPEKASNKDVVFIYDETKVEIDKKGKVEFHEDTDVIITIKATDGSSVSDSIHLILIDKDGGVVD